MPKLFSCNKNIWNKKENWDSFSIKKYKKNEKNQKNELKIKKN
jgi:hypothetical protein